MNRHLLVLSTLSVFAGSLLFVAPSIALANPTLTASTTIAVTASSTLPAITFAGGVTEVKATRTITVNSLPSGTQTIGLCVITFSSGTQDTNCSDNAALVNTTTDSTAALVAARIRTITGITDTGHGALTVGGSASTAIFTTTGTETTAAVITASTNGAITNNTVSTAGVIPVAATASTVVPAGLQATTTEHSLTIDGVTINLGNVALTASGVASAIAGATYTSGTSYLANGAYTVSPSAATVTFTRTATGAAGNTGLTVADSKYGANTQTSTFSFGNISSPYVYTITINGRNYIATFLGGVLQSVVDQLTSSLASDPDVTCSEATSLITCVGKSAEISFTASASVAVVPAPVGSAGGNSSSGGSSSGSTAAKVSAPAPTPAPAPVTSSASAPASAPKTSAPAPAPVVAPAPAKVVAPALVVVPVKVVAPAPVVTPVPAKVTTTPTPTPVAVKVAAPVPTVTPVKTTTTVVVPVKVVTPVVPVVTPAKVITPVKTVSTTSPKTTASVIQALKNFFHF